MAVLPAQVLALTIQNIIPFTNDTKFLRKKWTVPRESMAIVRIELWIQRLEPTTCQKDKRITFWQSDTEAVTGYKMYSTESQNNLSWKGPTRIIKIQLLPLLRTTQQFQQKPRSVQKLRELWQLWYSAHSLISAQPGDS